MSASAKSLRDLLEPCRQLTRELFCEMMPAAALVHTAMDHQLVDAAVSASDSSTAKLLDWVSLDPKSREAYTAFMLESRGGHRPLLLGSSPVCDVRVGDESVAAFHAQIQIADGEMSVRALPASTGGVATRLDGVELSGEWHALVSGNHLQLGYARFVVVSAADLYTLVRWVFQVDVAPTAPTA